VSERQNLILKSFLSGKEKIIEQTGQITQNLLDGYKQNILPLSKNENQKFLPKNEMKLLQ